MSLTTERVWEAEVKGDESNGWLKLTDDLGNVLTLQHESDSNLVSSKVKVSRIVDDVLEDIAILDLDVAAIAIMRGYFNLLVKQVSPEYASNANKQIYEAFGKGERL